MRLQGPYAQFREESLDQLSNLKPEDVFLFEDDEVEENYTVVARPDKQAFRVIKEVMDELRRIDERHYYYPADQLHLTLLGSLPVTLEAQEILKAVKMCLELVRLRFRMYGLGSGPYCSSVSCYPDRFSLYHFRKQLRAGLGVGGDDYSIHLTHYEYVGWINYLRYFVPPCTALLNKILDYKDTDWGWLEPRFIEVYLNRSKVLNPNKTSLVGKIDLG